MPEERPAECDAAIFERLQQTCFKHQETWKKWLPYYGVTKVEEVKFHVAGVVKNDNPFSCEIS
ncbi:uncharacterized protein PV07_10941 [Cladophialophora immunda]|uniref:Uncharacterized protein n=1 Tax=Cladophialophora immunda TaxID=569365 RepID=A0A0D1Z4X8_9EURO|nr:uncharacterized protein PV07_10941 [Cladophialophora immunda]KIW22666.1 hypothetical protein PV07_10941 [Cladophialophora immunda]